MKIMKSILAVAVVAFSAEVSAQVVFIPNFPEPDQVQTQTAQPASTEHVAQDQTATPNNAA